MRVKVLLTALLLSLLFATPVQAVGDTQWLQLPVDPTYTSSPSTYLGVSTTGYLYKHSKPLTSVVLAQSRSQGWSLGNMEQGNFCSTSPAGSDRVCVSSGINPAADESWYTIVWITTTSR